MIRLSETYETVLFVKTEYHMPEKFRFVSDPSQVLEVSIRATGSELLRHRFLSTTLPIDFSMLEKARAPMFFYVAPGVYRAAVRALFGDRMEILGIRPDTLLLNIDTLMSKRVRVALNTKVDLKSGFQLRDSLLAQPSYVEAFGPRGLIEKLETISTRWTLINEETDFQREVGLLVPENIQVTPQRVTLLGKISPIAEKMIIAPLEVVNTPENTQIKLFPMEVNVLCKGSLEDIKIIRSDDFKVVFDYKKYKESTGIYVPEILQQPPGIESKIMLDNPIEALVRQ